MFLRQAVCFNNFFAKMEEIYACFFISLIPYLGDVTKEYYAFKKSILCKFAKIIFLFLFYHYAFFQIE